MINLTYPVDLLQDYWPDMTLSQRNSWINYLERHYKYKTLHQTDIDIEVIKQQGPTMAGRLRDLYNDRANLLIDLRSIAFEWINRNVKFN